MLMLERKKGESVDLIDRDTNMVLCTVKVLEVMGDGSVRLGFQADHKVHIKRDNIKNSRAPQRNGSGVDTIHVRRAVFHRDSPGPAPPADDDDNFGNR